MTRPYRQHAFEAKPFAAEIARKRHGAGVDAHVLAQRASLAKLAAALVAFVGLLAGVHRSMLLHANVSFETENEEFASCIN